jgi:hypothetical protein
MLTSGYLLDIGAAMLLFFILILESSIAGNLLRIGFSIYHAIRLNFRLLVFNVGLSIFLHIFTIKRSLIVSSLIISYHVCLVAIVLHGLRVRLGFL